MTRRTQWFDPGREKFVQIRETCAATERSVEVFAAKICSKGKSTKPAQSFETVSMERGEATIDDVNNYLITHSRKPTQLI